MSAPGSTAAVSAAAAVAAVADLDFFTAAAPTPVPVSAPATATATGAADPNFDFFGNSAATPAPAASAGNTELDFFGDPVVAPAPAPAASADVDFFGNAVGSAAAPAPAEPEQPMFEADFASFGESAPVADPPAEPAPEAAESAGAAATPEAPVAVAATVVTPPDWVAVEYTQRPTADRMTSSVLNSCLMRPAVPSSGTIRCYILVEKKAMFNHYKFYMEKAQPANGFAKLFTGTYLYEESEAEREARMFACIGCHQRMGRQKMSRGVWRRVFEFAGLEGFAECKPFERDTLLFTAEEAVKHIRIKNAAGIVLGTLEFEGKLGQAKLNLMKGEVKSTLNLGDVQPRKKLSLMEQTKAAMAKRKSKKDKEKAYGSLSMVGDDDSMSAVEAVLDTNTKLDRKVPLVAVCWTCSRMGINPNWGEVLLNAPEISKRLLDADASTKQPERPAGARADDDGDETGGPDTLGDSDEEEIEMSGIDGQELPDYLKPAGRVRVRVESVEPLTDDSGNTHALFVVVVSRLIPVVSWTVKYFFSSFRSVNKKLASESGGIRFPWDAWIDSGGEAGKVMAEAERLRVKLQRYMTELTRRTLSEGSFDILHQFLEVDDHAPMPKAAPAPAPKGRFGSKASKSATSTAMQTQFNFGGGPSAADDDEPVAAAAAAAAAGSPSSAAGAKPAPASNPSVNTTRQTGAAAIACDWLPGAQLVRLTSRDPQWNEKLGCYTMSFHDGRVKQACEANFQLMIRENWDKDSKVKDATGAMVDNAPKNDKWRKGGSHIEVLQCGRVSKAINGQPARFHVDFRSPMSAIQAFAICLSNHGMADIKV